MRKNKGYTLVELVVAIAVLVLVLAEVGALMVNSQHLYKNGYYEVHVQESAQQAIQQVQDLLMNANVSVQNSGGITATSMLYEGTVSSDLITIKITERTVGGNGQYSGLNASPTTYKIGLRCDPNLGGAPLQKNSDGQLYSDLMMKKDSGTPVLIAEGVRSIRLASNQDRGETNVADQGHIYNLTTADVITLTINMLNHEYSYTATGEVYLRNRPGTGGDPVPASTPGAGADVKLTVLRIHNCYNLKSYLPVGYDNFVLESGDVTAYSLTTDGQLKCETSTNKQWDTEYNATIKATSSLSTNAARTISIHTDKVNDGSRVPVSTWSNTTGWMSNALPVTGICTCPQCAKNLIVDAQITFPDYNSAGKTVSPKDDTINKATGKLRLFYGGENNVKFKVHKETKVTVNGTEYPFAEGDEVPTGTKTKPVISQAVWQDEIFARAKEGVEINITNAKFIIEYRKKKASGTAVVSVNGLYDKTLIDKNYDTELTGGNTGGPRLKLNGDEDSQVGGALYYYPDKEGGQIFTKFKVGRIHVENKANAFSLDTNQHATNAFRYFPYVVDNGGYLRFHIWCSFDGLTWDGVVNSVNEPYAYIYDCYGYYYPNGVGTNAQMMKLMDIVGVSDSAIPKKDKMPDQTTEDPHPYEYYGGYN
ncbi:MAG: prepilin-type N-terminal cleavage/methylation domain-containing protein [Lachnospiraceae bacterium]|nr:prepilin-type N-terminal cleavage/methylation domain-containing protein [Lachnospiraceae bacterium]